jgi:hypothetical protein
MSRCEVLQSHSSLTRWTRAAFLCAGFCLEGKLFRLVSLVFFTSSQEVHLLPSFELGLEGAFAVDIQD